MPAQVREIAHDLIHHPFRSLVLRWNWKAALLSPILRGAFVYAATASAGPAAAASALTVEVLYRGLVSGFCGAIVEAFRSSEPYWAGQLTVVLIVPVVSDSLDFLVHWQHGTSEFGRSVAVSLALTIVSTAFNYFAMRRGALIVGEQRQTLLQDIATLPLLFVAFLSTIFRQLLVLFLGRRSALRGI
jgi:hypothetical protein